MPTDAAVVVRIIDVNDNAPTITVNTLASRGGGGGGGGGATAEVPENLPEGTFVAHVTVHDADSDEFGRVDCNLTDTAFSLLRRPDSNEFQVLFFFAAPPSPSVYMCTVSGQNSRQYFGNNLSKFGYILLPPSRTICLHFVCLCICLFSCLCVSRLTQKVVDEF